MPKIESGKVNNKRVTTKRHKKENGDVVVEEIVKKENDIESHKVDGEEIKKDNLIKLTEENSSMVSAKLLESINNNLMINNRLLESIKTQLVETNYYTTFLEKPNDIPINEYFIDRGYKINTGPTCG